MSSNKVFKKVLVTGGTGYIGSHIVIELVNSGFDPIIVDNLSNSHLECIERVEKIVSKKINFFKCDLKNKIDLEAVFTKNKDISCVIHLAGLKSVGESTEKPLLYYENNIVSTLNILECMNKHKIHDFIFSSSATVYGDAKSLPITEEAVVGNCSNPYGRTKYFIEEILIDLFKSDSNWNIVLLRYFNPVGAHSSGLIGEDPNGRPNNLMPYISQVAVGKLPFLKVFGNDYDTPDGTGVRDYIHVVDLAKGHVKAIEALKSSSKDVKIYNLGTGRGYSVLEMVAAMEKACNKKVEYKITERRKGDIASVYSSTEKANRELNWKAEKTLEEICVDTWRWQKNNPNGYKA